MTVDGDLLLIERGRLLAENQKCNPVPQKVLTIGSSNRQSLGKRGLEPVQEVCEELLTETISPLAMQQLQTLLLPGVVHSHSRELHSAKKRSDGDDLKSLQLPHKVASTQILLRVCNVALKKGETQQQCLGRATHLKLNGLQLQRLQDLGEHCPRLRVLYAFDNKITSIEPLRDRLEACYLQNNDLREMASWSQMLPQLRVLNLSRNCITRLEGLQQCQVLEELNLSHQKLTLHGPSTHFSFSTHTLAGLCNLRRLDMAGIGLQDLTGLGVLTSLDHLDVGENHLKDVGAVEPVLRSCPSLAWLRLEGNPLCHNTRYRDAVIANAVGPLSEVDGKMITEQQRNMFKVLEKRRNQSGINSARGIPKSANRSLAMAGGMALMAS